MAYQPGCSIVTDDDGRTKWIEAALAALARGGIEQVRVEVLAKDLGVTKGGFYRRFADRRALLAAILEGGRRDVSPPLRRTLNSTAFPLASGCAN